MQAGVEDTVEAEDGIDALQKVKEHNCAFDLIMLDINMPRVDGLTTLKQLKSMDDTKGIPVIMSRPIVGNLHSRDEWVDVQSMLQFYRICERFVEQKLGLT